VNSHAAHHFINELGNQTREDAIKGIGQDWDTNGVHSTYRVSDPGRDGVQCGDCVSWGLSGDEGGGAPNVESKGVSWCILALWLGVVVLRQPD